MAALFPPAKFQAFNSDGTPMVSGSLYAYVANSSTPQDTYTDSTEGTTNTNPVVLDSRGEADVWLGTGALYKLVLKDADGTTVWTVDQVGGPLNVATLAASGGSALVGFLQAGTGATARTVQAKLRDAVSVKDFGAVGDGVTDDTAALVAAGVIAAAGTPVYFPKGTYLTSSPLNFTTLVRLIGEPGARIKLTASASYVLRIGVAASYMHGSDVRDLILDGNGFATDGLYLNNLISANFDNIQVTNVTRAGLYLSWAQLCNFKNFTVSNNVETFTTTPVNGILADTSSCSANTFINPVIEGVSGAGIKGESLSNTLFLNGTSEGNDIGIDLGTAAGAVASGNIVVGMDLEVNTTTDIYLRATGSANTFIGLAAGYNSPAVQIVGADQNTFVGGSAGGFVLDSNSSDNSIDGVRLIGAGRTITDSGTRNTYRNVFNISDATTIADRPQRRRGYDVVGAATYAINAATTVYAVVAATAATITIGIPTNPVDGAELTVCVRNISGGGLTVTWDNGATGFKIAGWTDPATGFNRSAHFRYDANIGYWFAVSVGATDVAN